MREIEWTENSEKQDSVPVFKGFISLGKLASCEDY